MKDGVHIYNREVCNACGKCTETCYANALILTGKLMTVNEVAEEVLRDKVFYEVSNGGVTLSGGDPIFQHDFAQAILERCKAEGLHAVIETTANCRWMDLAALLPFTDMIIMDIKHFDSKRHSEVTGVSNENILDNARRLAKTGKPTIIRVPVIPTVNDTLEEIEEIAKFVHVFPNLQYIELLPFHRLGESKYRDLGLEYRASHLKTPTSEKMNELSKRVMGFGVEVRIG